MKISIITPSFNQGSYITQTFDSIIQQKHSNFEIEYIVMDGGSTDETVRLAKQYQSKFKKAKIDFYFFSKKDKGQADAINKGWKKATGDIVTYINSDDYYANSKTFEIVVRYFRRNLDVEWLFGGWNVVNQQGKLYKKFQPGKFSPTLFYCYGQNIGQPSVFFRRGLLKKTGMLDESLHLALDYDLWLRFSQFAKPAVIEKVFANLRYYSNAKSAKYMVKHNFEAYSVAKKHLPNFWLLPLLFFNYLIGRIMILIGRNISQTINRLN